MARLALEDLREKMIQETEQFLSERLVRDEVAGETSPGAMGRPDGTGVPIRANEEERIQWVARASGLQYKTPARRPRPKRRELLACEGGLS